MSGPDVQQVVFRRLEQAGDDLREGWEHRWSGVLIAEGMQHLNALAHTRPKDEIAVNFLAREVEDASDLMGSNVIEQKPGEESVYLPYIRDRRMIQEVAAVGLDSLKRTEEPVKSREDQDMVENRSIQVEK